MSGAHTISGKRKISFSNMFMEINDCDDGDSVSNSSIDEEDLYDFEVSCSNNKVIED